MRQESRANCIVSRKARCGKPRRWGRARFRRSNHLICCIKAVGKPVAPSRAQCAGKAMPALLQQLLGRIDAMSRIPLPARLQDDRPCVGHASGQQRWQPGRK